MSKNNDSGKYWPYMILGFLFIGITLGFWTIKSTISLPVHESNSFMQKYQDADKGANEIVESQARFDSKYELVIDGLSKSDFKPKYLKRKAHVHYKLDSTNSLSIKVSSKSGASVDGISAVALLTRPQTELDDKKLKCIKIDAGTFEIKDFSVQKFGRYIIRLKISDESNDTKYLDIYGYRAKK